MSADVGEGRKRTQLSIPATSEVSLGGGAVDLANMVGVLKLPSGTTEACLLKKMPGGELGNAILFERRNYLYFEFYEKCFNPINIDLV